MIYEWTIRFIGIIDLCICVFILRRITTLWCRDRMIDRSKANEIKFLRQMKTKYR
jgi:hypothetical protein